VQGSVADDTVAVLLPKILNFYNDVTHTLLYRRLTQTCTDKIILFIRPTWPNKNICIILYFFLSLSSVSVCGLILFSFNRRLTQTKISEKLLFKGRIISYLFAISEKLMRFIVSSFIPIA
jgi:hypothetical protein